MLAHSDVFRAAVELGAICGVIDGCAATDTAGVDIAASDWTRTAAVAPGALTGMDIVCNVGSLLTALRMLSHKDDFCPVRRVRTGGFEAAVVVVGIGRRSSAVAAVAGGGDTRLVRAARCAVDKLNGEVHDAWMWS